MCKKDKLRYCLTLIMGISLLFLFTGCKKNTSEIDIELFIQMAKAEICTDWRNSLFIIDNNLVVYIREGNCPDASYRIALYKEDIDNKLCEIRDSIVGPVLTINDEAYRSMFNIIINNQDQADLGLGPNYVVEEIHF